VTTLGRWPENVFARQRFEDKAASSGSTTNRDDETYEDEVATEDGQHGEHVKVVDRRRPIYAP
jgi:hypothetical protein